MAPVRISKFRHVHGSSAPKERSQAALPRRQPTGRGTPGQHPAPAERRPAAPRTGRCYENTGNAPAASPDSNGIDGNNNYFAIPWQVSAPRPAPRSTRPAQRSPPRQLRRRGPTPRARPESLRARLPGRRRSLHHHPALCDRARRGAPKLVPGALRAGAGASPLGAVSLPACAAGSTVSPRACVPAVSERAFCAVRFVRRTWASRHSRRA